FDLGLAMANQYCSRIRPQTQQLLDQLTEVFARPAALERQITSMNVEQEIRLRNRRQRLRREAPRAVIVDVDVGTFGQHLPDNPTVRLTDVAITIEINEVSVHPPGAELLEREAGAVAPQAHRHQHGRKAGVHLEIESPIDARAPKP